MKEIGHEEAIHGDVALAIAGLLSGCGGGGGSSAASNNTQTPAQIAAALTPAAITAYSNAQITALDVNIQYLSEATLRALNFNQIGAITSMQIAALSPAQIHFLGAGTAGLGGVAQFPFLSQAAWATLAGDPAKVATLTSMEIVDLTAPWITAFGANINRLSDAALRALRPMPGQIAALTSSQINALSPAQIQLLGAGPAGLGGYPQLVYLNPAAWAALANDPLKVATFTPAVIGSLTAPLITALGTNINALSDAALAALRPLLGDIAALTAAQIASLSPMQFSVVAGLDSGTGMAYMNVAALGAISANQAAMITPANMYIITPAQLAAFSTAALAGLTPTTIASLSATQKGSLSVAQHTACGC